MDSPSLVSYSFAPMRYFQDTENSILYEGQDQYSDNPQEENEYGKRKRYPGVSVTHKESNQSKSILKNYAKAITNFSTSCFSPAIFYTIFPPIKGYKKKWEFFYGCSYQEEGEGSF